MFLNLSVAEKAAMFRLIFAEGTANNWAGSNCCFTLGAGSKSFPLPLNLVRACSPFWRQLTSQEKSGIHVVLPPEVPVDSVRLLHQLLSRGEVRMASEERKNVQTLMEILQINLSLTEERVSAPLGKDMGRDRGQLEGRPSNLEISDPSTARKFASATSQHNNDRQPGSNHRRLRKKNEVAKEPTPSSSTSSSSSSSRSSSRSSTTSDDAGQQPRSSKGPTPPSRKRRASSPPMPPKKTRPSGAPDKQCSRNLSKQISILSSDVSSSSSDSESSSVLDCHTCHASFDDADGLRRHYILSHYRVKIFLLGGVTADKQDGRRCSACREVYASPADLAIHVGLEHGGLARCLPTGIRQQLLPGPEGACDGAAVCLSRSQPSKESVRGADKNNMTAATEGSASRSRRRRPSPQARVIDTKAEMLLSNCGKEVEPLHANERENRLPLAGLPNNVINMPCAFVKLEKLRLDKYQKQVAEVASTNGTKGDGNDLTGTDNIENERQSKESLYKELLSKESLDMERLNKESPEMERPDKESLDLEPLRKESFGVECTNNKHPNNKHLRNQPASNKRCRKDLPGNKHVDNDGLGNPRPDRKHSGKECLEDSPSGKVHPSDERHGDKTLGNMPAGKTLGNKGPGKKHLEKKSLGKTKRIGNKSNGSIKLHSNKSHSSEKECLAKTLALAEHHEKDVKKVTAASRPPRLFSCHLCPAKLSTQNSLLAHHSLTHFRRHLEEKGGGLSQEELSAPFDCPLCPTAFPRYTSLLVHLGRVHEDLEKFLPRQDQLISDDNTSSTPAAKVVDDNGSNDADVAVSTKESDLAVAVVAVSGNAYESNADELPAALPNFDFAAEFPDQLRMAEDLVNSTRWEPDQSLFLQVLRTEDQVDMEGFLFPLAREITLDDAL